MVYSNGLASVSVSKRRVEHLMLEESPAAVTETEAVIHVCVELFDLSSAIYAWLNALLKSDASDISPQRNSVDHLG